MGSGYLTSPLLLIINTLFNLYIMLVLMRFVLQWLRADFYNPVSQFIVHATTPLLKPLRRFIPGFGGQDIAALVLALVILIIKYLLIRAMGAGIIEIGNAAASIGSASIFGLLLMGSAEIIATLLNIFLFAIIIEVILSWVNPGGYNPVIGLIHSVAEPALRPFRRFIPALGGLDLTPLFATLGIMVAKMLILPPLLYLAMQL